MKHLALLSLLLFSFACGPIPPPKPPTPVPPTPTTKILQNRVVDAVTKQPLAGVVETMHTDLCGDLFSATTDASGQAVFTLPFTCGGGFNITLTAPNYTSLAQRFDGMAATPWGPITFPMPVGNSTTTPSIMQLTSNVSPTPTWTVDQLQDIQGDLMIWMPELGRPDYTGILPGARGIDSGWIWSLWIQWYNPADRQRIYDKVKSYGWTHVAIAVEDVGIGPGYHNLRPTTAADQAAYGPLMTTVHRELVANGLIPMCAGVAPGPAASGGAEIAPGFDPSVCMVAMSDWDNTTWAAERVKKISNTFPNAILYYERPGDPNRSSGIDKSPNDPVDASWDITNGGAWLRSLLQAFPRFKGVMYEVNNWPDSAAPDPVSRCVAEIQKAHDGFWRDVQEVRFETNTYDKFWNGSPKEMYDALEARLQAAVPFLSGYTSGGASHPVRREKQSSGGFVGELDPHQATGQHLAGDFADWAQTTHITKLTLGTSSVSVEMDNNRPNGWPDTLDRPGMGALLYSFGLAEQINGQWNISAPIQLWRGLTQSGGSIQLQNVGDGRGQIQENWFYDGRWGTMNGYQPKEGEVIGFFICAGDCRDGNGGFSPVHERSNIVLFKLPASGQAVILQ